GASGCPSCGAPLARGAILCAMCGYNVVTKQRKVAGRAVGLGAAMAPTGQDPWYKTAYPYLGAILVLLGVLYLLGKNNPRMMPLFVGTALLYALVPHICVVV